VSRSFAREPSCLPPAPRLPPSAPRLAALSGHSASIVRRRCLIWKSALCPSARPSFRRTKPLRFSLKLSACRGPIPTFCRPASRTPFVASRSRSSGRLSVPATLPRPRKPTEWLFSTQQCDRPRPESQHTVISFFPPRRGREPSQRTHFSGSPVDHGNTPRGQLPATLRICTPSPEPYIPS
jgi:hypothetical protein